MKRKLDPTLSTLAEVRRVVAKEEVIFVDPGTGGTGWAIFHFPERCKDAALAPHSWGVIKPTSRHKTWRARFEYIATTFSNDVLFNAGPERMVLEWPEFWSRSRKSRAAARRGDLVKLAALCGALELAAIQASCESSLLLTPRAWKGSLSKPAVDLRIRHAIHRKYSDHVSDAVGMGLAVQGFVDTGRVR